MGSSTRRTELELFESSGRGDAAALRELNDRIERCVRSRLGGGSESEIHEICDRVRERFERLRVRGFSGVNQAFRTYLYRVVASQVVQVRMERAGEGSLDDLVDMPQGGAKTLGEFAKGMIDPAWDILKELETKQEHHLIRTAFARLEGRCRKLLWEREVERRPEQEVAERLQMTLANVWASMHRCKERLYRLLLLTLAAGSDPDAQVKVSRLAEKLIEPLRTVFRLWWEEQRTIRDIAKSLNRDEREVKYLLSRAKAGIWHLAQESGTL